MKFGRTRKILRSISLVEHDMYELFHSLALQMSKDGTSTVFIRNIVFYVKVQFYKLYLRIPFLSAWSVSGSENLTMWPPCYLASSCPSVSHPRTDSKQNTIVAFTSSLKLSGTAKSVLFHCCKAGKELLCSSLCTQLVSYERMFTK
jgi:hypothetical protein